jgi:penicillin-binding protein 1A
MKIFTRPPSSRAVIRRILKVVLVLAIIAVVGAGIAAGTAFVVYRQLGATYDLSKLSQMPSRSEVFDADGKPIGRLQSEQNRVLVPLKDISPRFIDAILTREDARFWEHHGLDWRGIARAAIHNARGGGMREGASTITQQLARNTFALGGQNLHRKLLEAMVASRIEEKYSKDQILEFYINRIYMGAGVYGVEAASQKYFGKPGKQLTLGEAAMLAGIVRNPNRNSPFRNPDGAKADRDSVLDRLVTLNKVSAPEAAAAKQEPLRLALSHPSPGQDDGIMEAVRSELDDIISDDQIDQGGLRVYTTIDPRLQKLAMNAVATHLEKIEQSKGYAHLTRAQYLAQKKSDDKADPTASPDYLQGALLAVDNKTGAIVAMVGSRNYDESHYNRALYSRRQIGSTFKPFVYAAAFARGLQPASLVEDSPLRPGEIKTASREWKPANSDGQFLGPVRADAGLIQSRNIMSIRVGEWAGMDMVRALAKRVGLEAPALPSMYLGAFETTLRDLTGAYTVFPNRGIARAAYFIERVDGPNGQPLYQSPHEERKAMNPEVFQTTSDVLERVMTEGTAKQAASLGFRAPGAGKTGTTNDYKDAWFVGYTSSLTCGVWVGMDKPQTIMAKGYGSALALPIWTGFMQAAIGAAKRYPALALHSPGPVASPTAATVSTEPVAQNGGFVYAENNRADSGSSAPAQLPALAEAAPVTPAVASAPVAVYSPPSDPGSRYITDPRTGRVIGIDGSGGAMVPVARALPVEPPPQTVPPPPQAALPPPAVPASVPAAVPNPVMPRRAESLTPAQRLTTPAWQELGEHVPRARPVAQPPPMRSRAKYYVMPDGSLVLVRNPADEEEEY